MKQTRFNAHHRRLGARMIEFCGWDMPVEYKGLIEEHLACRHAAGLFDVSHMGEIHVTGKDALAFVQHMIAAAPSGPISILRLRPISRPNWATSLWILSTKLSIKWSLPSFA